GVERNVAPALPGATAGPIKDHAGLFSATALSRAAADIKTIRSDLGQEVTVETFPRLPPGKVKQFTAMSQEARKQFLDEWLRERMKAAQTDGVFLLICRDPHVLEIGTGEKARQKDFTPAKRDELFKLMTGKFKENNFDDGLADGLLFVDETFRGKRRPDVAKGSPDPVIAAKDGPSTTRPGSNRGDANASPHAATKTSGGFDPMW